MADGTPLLRLLIKEKRFAGVPVLAGLVLSVAAGELVALVGPSGCGKSTVLMLAAGLDGDFTGERHLAPHLHPAVHFQEPSLLPWRSLAANVDMALPAPQRNKGHAGRWLGRVELPVQSHGQFPTQVSLGMQRRAALARTLAMGSDLLLLDEPLVSLDTPLAERLRALLLQQMQERPSLGTLLVTHDLAEAVQLADRILVLGNRPAGVIQELRPAGKRGERSPQQISMAVRQLYTAEPSQSSIIDQSNTEKRPEPEIPWK